MDLSLNITFMIKNIADPDEMQHSLARHLGIHGYQIYMMLHVGINGVNYRVIVFKA